MVDPLNLSQLHPHVSSGGVVHQTLHGYSDGHRLIRGSIELPDAAARLMLRLSDLSGSSVSSGFDEYICGYPLQSTGWYVLAKTWYATEMPRPGCVWTHSLLISEEFIGFPNLFPFLSLFERPSSRHKVDNYGTPISGARLDIAVSSMLPDLQFSDSKMPPFAAVLYSTEGKPILIPAKTSKEYEQLIIAAWSQQWPALRKQFTFCTGSFASRSIAGRPFDVQCVPRQLVREVQLDITGIDGVRPIIFDSTSQFTDNPNELAISELEISTKPEFKEFLWQCADSTTRRGDFQFLAAVYSKLQGELSIDDLVALVAELFQGATQAIRLKALLFGDPLTRIYTKNFNEASVLSALGSTERPEAFDVRSLQLKLRSELLSNDPHAAWSVINRLFRLALNPLSREILGALISNMDLHVAKEIADQKPQFLATLVTAKPELAASWQIWAAAGDRKRELFEGLLRNEALDQRLIPGIISALIETNSGNFVRRAFDAWGKVAIYSALDWSEKNMGKMPDSCSEALKLHIGFVMDWVEASPRRIPRSLLSVAHILAFQSSKISSRDTTVWQELLMEVRSIAGDDEGTFLMTFLLALGLQNAPPDPLKLIRSNFEYIYRSAWDNQLSDNAWEILDPITPHIAWPNDWDKCERMQRALISAFVAYNWSPHELPNLISNSTIFKAILKSASKVPGGHRVSDKLRRH